MKNRLMPGLLILFVSACSSGSGVDSGKAMKDLTAEEQKTICQWYSDETGGAKETQCGALTFSPQTVDECVAEDLSTVAATCTVATVEACVDAMAGDPCQLFTAEDCKAYANCMSSDQGNS